MIDAHDGETAEVDGVRDTKHRTARAEFEATVADIEAQVRATNDKINARSGRNLSMAVTVGIALGVALILSLIFIKAVFVFFAAVMIGFTAFELASALRFAGRDVPRIPVVLATATVAPLSFYLVSAGHWLGILAGIALVSVWRVGEQLVPSKRSSALDLLKDVMAGVFVLSYVVFLASFTIVLTAQDGGQWWTLAFLIVVIATDTGAYATGLIWGKHPLAPSISPKKTWEGFVGSIVFAVITAVLLAIFMLDQPWWVGAIMGITIVLTATGGDLSESLIKRDLGIKDISTWLPGHGGFLDRLDSILPSAAAAFGLYLVFA
jgi:phosphatidate cytidylyltransferase